MISGFPGVILANAMRLERKAFFEIGPVGAEPERMDYKTKPSYTLERICR
ncbi:MAG: LemA family protein [Bacillus subtilis]|nr:LemA family protein [Bacillus subtilis]